MRRTIALLVLAGLVAFSAPVALAAETKIGGYIETNVEYAIGEDEPFTFGRTFYRINVTSDISENFSIYGRIQGNAGEPVNADEDTGEVTGAPAITLAYFTYKNLGVEGLNLGVGRQSKGWSRLNVGSSQLGGVTFDGISLAIPAAPATVDVYYSVPAATAGEITPDGAQAVVHVGYSTDVSGVGVGVDGILKNVFGTGVAYGVSASADIGGFGDVYFELSKSADADELDAIYVGTNISALEPSTGITAFVEYSVKGETVDFKLSRDLLEGLTLWFSGSKPLEGDLGLTLGVTASTSF